MADAIDAAFAAGASQVNSQFSVSAGTATAQAGAGGYGYAPSQQGQPSSSRSQQGFQGPGRGPMGAPTQASSSDLRLAQQVASQLRQQLPPGQNIQLVQPQSIYVTAQRGTVTLHGYVQNSNQKQQAQQIVQSIQGVQNVRNDLTILSTQGAAARGSQGMGGSQSSGSSTNQGFSGQGNQGFSGSGQPEQQSERLLPAARIHLPRSVQSSRSRERAARISTARAADNRALGGTTGQSQYGQNQYGQGGTSTSQQGMGGMTGQDQSSQAVGWAADRPR